MKKALLLGALSALALPPLTFFPVLLICVPGLLGLIAQAPTWRRAFWIGFWFGFAHHMLGLYWLTEAILVKAEDYWWLVPLAVPMLAAVLAVLIGLPCLVAWHARNPARRVLALAGAWVLADLARQFIATGFPWNLWGSSVELPGRAGDVLIQLGALTGIHGMTLAVMLIAGSISLGGRARAAAATAAIAWAGFGLWRLHLPNPPPLGVAAMVVQANVTEQEMGSPGSAGPRFDRYLSLSAQGLQTSRLTPSTMPTVLIWPEAASPYLLTQDAGARAAIAAVTGPDTPALIGSLRLDGGYPYNSLIALDPPPRVAGLYDKWHLVPFGEYQPSWLPGIQLIPGSFAFGPGPRTLHLPDLPPFGPLICYEALFSGQIIDRADRPAWLVNITDDAWFGDSTGPRQHLQAARMRAVEEGLPLVRAANTGISAAFDARGHELGRIGLNQAGVERFDVPGTAPPTFYSKFGLRIPFFLAIATLLLGFYQPLRRQIVS